MSDFRIQGVIDADARRFQATIAECVRSFGSLRRAQDETVVSARVLERQTKDLTKALQDQNKQLLGLAINFRAARNAMLSMALGTAITGFQGLTASVGALGAGLVELAAQAGQLSAGLGVLAASGFAAIGQGAVVAMLSLKDLSKAFTTTGTDHEKAMAKLTAPAREFVGQLKDMQMAFREVKLLAQQGLFEGVVKGVRAAMPILQPLKQVVYDTARAMGYLADRVGILIGSRAHDLQAFGERNVVTLRRMGDAAINLGDAFLTVMRAADPFIGHVTAGLVTLSQKFDQTVQRLRATGGLADFFTGVTKSWDTWTSTFGNVGTGLLHIFTTALGPSRAVADSIQRASVAFKDWTEGRAGQSQMTRFLNQSNSVLGSMARFAGALGRDLAGLAMGGSGQAATFFDTLRVHVLPVLDELLQRTSSGLFTNLMQLVGAFADLIRAALPGLDPVTVVLRRLADALTQVLKWTTPLVQMAPGITKLVAAFAIGGGILGAWSKFADLLGLVFLRARMVVGLAPEMAGFGALSRNIFLRGGRNQAAEGAGAVVAGGGGGGVIVRGGGQVGNSFGNRIRGAGNYHQSNLPYLAPGRLTVDAATANRLEAIIKDEEQLAGVMAIGAHGARGANGQFIPNSRYGATGQRTAAYRDFQNLDLTGKSSFLKFRENIGGAVHDGVAKGLDLAKPVVAGVFGTALINGMLTALSDGQSKLRNRVQDFWSGLTFGLAKSSAQIQSENAAALQKMLGGGTLDFHQLGKKFDLGLALRKGGLDPKLLQTKFTVNTQQGLAALRDVVKALEKTGQISDDTAQKFLTAGKTMSEGLRKAQVKEWTDEVKRNWAAMDHDSQGRLTDIRHTVELNTGIIKQRLGSDTRAGQVALANNFKQAAAAIQKSMADGKTSVATGTAAIKDEMMKALQALGFTGQQADQKTGTGLRHGQVLQNPSARQPGQNAPGGAAAQGMLSTIPGQPGRDSVPMNVGGRNIMAAPGEDVAVVNRHQRKVLDQRLGDMGGFAGLFQNVRTPHQQNEVKGYASGGIVSGGGSSVFDRIAQAASSIDARHFPYKWGGGHNSSFSGPYDCSGAWSAILHAAGLLNAPETSGQFMNFGDPGPGTVTLYANPSHVYGSIAGKFWGTSGANPGGGAGFFPGGPRPGFTVRHVPQKLLGKIGDALGLGSGAGPTLARVLAKGSGLLGQLEQTALDKDLSAAQSRVDAAAAASSSLGGGQFGGGQLPEGGAPAANMAIAKSMAKSLYGWNGQEIADLMLLGNRESGWRTTAVNGSSGAFGIGQFLGKTRDAYAKFGANSTSAGEQINAMLHYIHDRYGSPVQAWAHEQSAGWYERGGIIGDTLGWIFASAGQPPIPGRGGGTPNVNPGAAVTPGSKGGNNTNGKPKPKPKHKKAKPPKPFAGHHPLPNLSGIKGDAKKAKARKKAKPKQFYPKLHGGSDVAAALLAQVVPDYQTTYENPIAAMQAQLTNLAGWADLTDEQAVVTLTDSGSFKDLTAFWAAHPDLAQTYQSSLDSFDVLNTGGMTVQGVWTPGIAQHVNELLAQIQVHTGAQDPSARGGLTGAFDSYVKSITTWGLPGATRLRDQAISELTRLHHHYDMWQGRRAKDNDELAKLTSGGVSWEQRVADNKARIKVLQDYKRRVHDSAVGHRLTTVDQHNLNKADQEISDLSSEDQKLAASKPPAQHRHETKRQRSARLSRMAHLRTDRDDALLRLDELAASRDGWNTDGGLAKDWTDRISTYTQSITDQSTALTDLKQNRVPAEGLAVASLGKEMSDWSGTIVPLPAVPTADTSDQQQKIADLLEQQNQQLIQQLSVANAEKSIFSGFAPLLAKSLVGVFEHGGVVPRTGLALVHQNETIIPNPDGPYGNRAAAALAGGRGGSMSVHLHGDLAPLMRLIDARIDGRAPKLVDKKLGRDGRSLHFAPGG